MHSSMCSVLNQHAQPDCEALRARGIQRRRSHPAWGLLERSPQGDSTSFTDSDTSSGAITNGSEPVTLKGWLVYFPQKCCFVLESHTFCLPHSITLWTCSVPWTWGFHLRQSSVSDSNVTRTMQWLLENVWPFQIGLVSALIPRKACSLSFFFCIIYSSTCVMKCRLKDILILL